MLLKVDDGQLVNMHLARFQQMTLFLTDMIFPDQNTEREGKVTVTYQPPKGDSNEIATTIDIPLEPKIDSLKVLDVVMHSSPTKAYDMGTQYNSWFSNHFGFDVVLAYIGQNRRPVLGNMPPSAANKSTQNGWLSSLSKTVGLNWFKENSASGSEGITFADLAPFLVVSETSLHNVSARLPKEMDITKFRPNIVISGADKVFEEDYWAELKVNDDIALVLTNNCGRCVSINIDFDTGAPGTGEMGTVLKKLMKDRRIDQGLKYSPIFGRYGFLGKGCEGTRIKVGDEVEVSKRNTEHTTFGKLI